jgi:hypothetical protein
LTQKLSRDEFMSEISILPLFADTSVLFGNDEFDTYIAEYVSFKKGSAMSGSVGESLCVAPPEVGLVVIVHVENFLLALFM